MTITRDMESVTKAVEKGIGAKFGVIFDDWMHGIEHFIAMYGCFKHGDLAPIINDVDVRRNAEDHMATLVAFLSFLPSSQLGRPHRYGAFEEDL
ncbi:hypothetical protein PHMEG_00016552 [Phytophthora megakarya]|uniref:Uncharacterized protein n=1 Tax=Phytophthora megakarya TaxID=4795 RepID=A0A225VYJ5_9STRA|nr:hypothetical protein PHMEG_00016552 [Phytophthora megakarya]